MRDTAVLVQSNLAFLTFIDLHLRSQIVSDYQPLFLIFNFACTAMSIFKYFLDVYISRGSPILLRSFHWSFKYNLYYKNYYKNYFFQPIRFKLNHQSTRLVPGEKDCSIWVGDLTPDVDDLGLYKFFAQRFNTCRTAKGIHPKIFFKEFPLLFRNTIDGVRLYYFNRTINRAYGAPPCLGQIGGPGVRNLFKKQKV